MRLEQLTLTNFRGFESLEITFDPHVTVLLGGNMSGKTAALDAAAIALGDFLAGVEVARRGIVWTPRPLVQSDTRRAVHHVGGTPDFQIQGPAMVAASAQAAGQRWRWEHSTTDDHVPSIRQHANSVAHHVQRGHETPLPVLAAYGTWRSARSAPVMVPPAGAGNRFDGYGGCLDATVTLHGFYAWMKKQTLVGLQRGKDYEQLQLNAVVSATVSCIGDVTSLWYDVEFDELRMERRGGGLFEFSMLSDGYRCMVAMAADIAWRAAVLNPQFGAEAHLMTEGVVLIDEVDLHLHPGWQRRVLGDLRRTFPKVQFIVTTHSPQVVASVQRSQVRLLEDNKLVASDLFVEGRDSNELLEDVFGVPRRPVGAQAEIDAVFRLIEDEDFVAARARLEVLEQSLGPDDAQVVRARWAIDTEDPQPVPSSAAAS